MLDRRKVYGKRMLRERRIRILDRRAHPSFLRILFIDVLDLFRRRRIAIP